MRTGQSQPHEIGEIQAHQRRGLDLLAFAIAQQHRAAQLARFLAGGDAHVVTGHAELLGQGAALDVAPGLEPLVPVIRQFIGAQALDFIEPGGRGNQRRDGDRKREGADAGILLPAVLVAVGTRAHHEAHGRAHHLRGAG